MVRVRRLVMCAAFAAGVAAALGVLALDARVRTYLAGPPLGGIRIYAAPPVLRTGAAAPEGGLARRLARLGYRAATGEALAPGEYRATKSGLEIAQRPSPAPWADPPRRLRIALRAGRIAEIRDVAAGPLARVELEPELLAVAGSAGPTLGAEPEPSPAACRAAVLAAEDRHFYRHPGIDPLAIARAILADLRAGSLAQGGSTITQQLVKNALLTPRRTLGRKLQEAVLAVLVERRASKDEILDRYLSSVYLGVDGGLPVHGFPQAAQVYFGKPLGELDPAECALIAGIIRAPNGLAPRRHGRAAVARRNRVLEAMVRSGLLDQEAAAHATAEPLRLTPPRGRSVGALWVAAEVERELRRTLPQEVAEAPGLAVHTSVDADAQRAAERAVRRGLDALEKGRVRGERLEGALVALDPHSGRIVALVGGRDYGASQLDHAVAMRRQPGSAFKPFVYLAAVDPVRRGGARPWTVASPLDDTPVAVRVSGGVWRPANYDGTFAGTVTIADALADSRNAATVRLALDVGLDAVAGAATDLGLAPPLPRVPALALGVAETSLLELTAAYGVFASGGWRRPPSLVTAVVSPAGDVLDAVPPAERRVLTPGVAYVMTYLLAQVVDRGTGAPARAAGLRGPAAGKTGTTDATRDAWFVGFTPAVVAGVWVGHDGNRPTGFTGAQAALPIWTEFVRAAGRGAGADAFAVPDDVVWREVDPVSGRLATASCPEAQRVPFLAGTEPRETCAQHRRVWAAAGGAITDAVRGGGRAVEGGGRRLRDWFGRLFR